MIHKTFPMSWEKMFSVSRQIHTTHGIRLPWVWRLLSTLSIVGRIDVAGAFSVSCLKWVIMSMLLSLGNSTIKFLNFISKVIHIEDKKCWDILNTCVMVPFIQTVLSTPSYIDWIAEYITFNSNTLQFIPQIMTWCGLIRWNSHVILIMTSYNLIGWEPVNNFDLYLWLWPGVIIFYCTAGMEYYKINVKHGQWYHGVSNVCIYVQ